MRKRPIRHDGTWSSARFGFTLLEVLLTSLLASVILVALWSLSDIYLKLFVAGKNKIEETQIVRGLMQQFAKDLLQVIQLAEEENPLLQSRLTNPSSFVQTQAVPQQIISPPQLSVSQSRPSQQPRSNSIRETSPQPPSTVTQPNSEFVQRPSDQMVPKFGLFGKKQALRLIVLQTDPNSTREPTELAEILPQPGQARHPFASELRTIQYTFAWPYESSSNDRQHPPGLIRREWDWETWATVWQASHPTTGSISPSQMLPENHAEWTEDDATALEDDNAIFHVPQVNGLEFRYYDGERWESEWNSWERRRLPLLVEILLQVKPLKETSRPAEGSTGETETTSSLSEDNASNISSASSSRNGIIYRRLIHLPFADRKAMPEAHGPVTPPTNLANSGLPSGRFQP